LTHDLVVSGGRVLCPGTGIDGNADVAIDDGLVSAVGEGLEGRERIDAAGLLVVPGLIDLHVHVYEGVSHYGIDADTYLLRRGTTTGVDVGSAGAQTFPGLRRMVIDEAQTRVYAYLHIAVEGMISALVGELEDLRWASVEQCVRVAEANRDVIAGVKLRAGYQMVGDDPRPALALALEAAGALGLPLMAHVIDMRMPLPELLAQLRPNDVVTHCYHGNEGGLLDDGGRVWGEAFAARERGVLFDVGHGSGSFVWRVARAALAQGFPPDTISSDIHAHNCAGPVHDLPRTLSKLLHLGLPLPEVIAAATSRAGAHLVHVAPAGLGTLAAGAPGDLTLLELRRGRCELSDGEHRLSGNVTEHAEQRLVARSVVRAGTAVACDELT
jgi:dihydroorotase